jgi:hypothetical protein
MQIKSPGMRRGFLVSGKRRAATHAQPQCTGVIDGAPGWLGRGGFATADPFRPRFDAKRAHIGVGRPAPGTPLAESDGVLTPAWYRQRSAGTPSSLDGRFGEGNVPFPGIAGPGSRRQEGDGICRQDRADRRQVGQRRLATSPPHGTLVMQQSMLRSARSRPIMRS